MTRLILLVVLAVLTWYYFPETRAILMDAVEPVVLPVLRRNSSEEMSQVARHVVDHERLTGSVPSLTEWFDWLAYRYSSAEISTDPWGSPYQLVVWPDSLAVVSLGPDRTRLTRDDFQVVTARE